MKKALVVIIWVTCVAGVWGMKNVTFEEIIKKLPSRVMGWKKSAQRAGYNSKTLYKYINCGAELYISYDFTD